MASEILTLRQLEDALRSIICLSIGLNPSDPQSNDRVRISWPRKGSPDWGIDEDVLFIKVSLVNDPYTKQRDITYTPNTSSSLNNLVSYTRAIGLNIIAYGPNGFDDIESIKNGLFDRAEELAAYNLYMVVDLDAPVRAPELFGGLWWERQDFNVMFYEKAISQSVIPVIDKVNVHFAEAKGIIIREELID